MATDRYSDDHKIVVGGGSGTLTVDATLDIAGELSADMGINLPDGGSVRSDGNLNLTSGGDDSYISLDSLYFSTRINPTTASEYIYVKSGSYGANSIHWDTGVWTFYDGTNFKDFTLKSNNLYINSKNDIIITSNSDNSTTASVMMRPKPSLDAYFKIENGTYGDTSSLKSEVFTINTNSTSISSPNLTVSGTGSSDLFSFSGINESGPIVKITNNGRLSGVGDYSTDIMELKFNPSDSGIPDEYNNWILFTKESDTKGSIEGYQSTTSSYTNKVFSPFTASISSSSSDYLGSGLYISTGSGPAFTTTSNSAWDGYVVYKSGNQDYGEWIEIGDYDEWPIDKSNVNLKSKIIGFQEGTLVYVRDSKFWKNSPGTPMIVTNRSIVVGNTNYKNDSRFGEVLSFIGQVPTIVMGPVKDGDLLIPFDGQNYCVGISKDDISFSQYKNCIGTAWSSISEENLGFVNCAIGVK